MAGYSRAMDMEIEDEAKLEPLLLEKVKLEDGTHNYVFSKKFDDYNKAYWRCNICDVSVGGPLEKHSMGRKHQTCLGLPTHPVVLWGKINAKPQARFMGDLKLAPGEPVPPGFEDEVRTITEIQTSLDAFHSGPLIGLEYLVELIGYEDEREPQYICLLCDKRGDPRTVMAHLVSFNHRMTYLHVHFPTVYRAVSPYNTKQYRRNVQNTVQSICEAVEKKFGRLTPQAADKETFERRKKEYFDNANKVTHPSERLGDTFEHLVDRDAIIALPKVDTLQEIKKANQEQQLKNRLNKKRDPSPPVVAMPAIRNKTKSDRRSLSSISSISSSSLSSPRSRSRSRSNSKSKHLRRRHPSYKRSKSRSRSPYGRYRHSRSYSRSPPPRRDQRYNTGGPPSFYKRLPWQRPEYSRKDPYHIDRRPERKAEMLRNERFEEYRKSCISIEAEMDKILEQHEKNPEKHSMYPEEWKKFWNRRYKELQAEHKDPTKHDFKPEWIDFWNKRMKEMHDDELKAKKDAIRKRLNIPEEPSPISFKIKNKNGKESHPKEKEVPKKLIQVPSTADPDIIVIDDSKDEDFPPKRSHSPWEREPSKDRNPSRDREHSRLRELSRERSRKREFSHEREITRKHELSRERSHERPFKRDSREFKQQPRNDYYKPRPYREEYKKKPIYVKVDSPPYQPESEGDINIVAVLRLLTALEEKLGSLGPRVIEMLSQALGLEKTEANSAEKLLDNDVNCVFFETVKEKLKGQLLAGMVEPSAEKTFKNAIQKIASLLHFAAERKRENEKKQKVKNLEPVKIPGIGTIDKSAIARQIATALISQGKTDVTQDELEQLINAVVGMAQASQNSGKPVSTASFIQQLSASKAASTETTTEAPKVDLMSTALQMLQQNTTKPTEPTSSSTQNSMEGLSDSDLKTLLQNFKDLSTDEQHGLITYLKKLESREPERVERLRKFVKLGPVIEPDKPHISGRISPFSNREAGANPSVEDPEKNKSQNQQQKIIDSDEEEYSFEDVFRAASKNVSEKQAQEEKADEDINVNFNDTKAIIANLMGQLGNANKSLNLLGLVSTASTNVTPSIINIAPVPQQGMPDVSKIINNIPSNLLNNIKIPMKNSVMEQQNINYPINTSNALNNYGNYGNYPQRNYNYDNFNQAYPNPNAANYNQMNDFNYNYGNALQEMGQGMRPPFNRQGQYPPYDSRQNYY